MAMRSVRQYISFEQYLLLVSNVDQKYEYHDGQVRLLADGPSDHAAIALNLGVALDSALSDDSLCRPYIADKLVRVTPTRVVIPDVVVTCDNADHGKSQIIHSPLLIVEVLSRSTEITDRFEKLALYQAKESIQEIVLSSQYIQRVEVFTRSATGWLYQQYGVGQSIHLISLNITIEVKQLYRRLSIPAVVEQVEDDNEPPIDTSE